MFNKRQDGLQISQDPTIVLEDDNGQLSRKASSKDNLKLDMTRILLNDTVWLTCTIIDEAQHLLKSMTHMLVDFSQ